MKNLTWEDKPQTGQYDSCLLTYIPKYLAEEIERLAKEIKVLTDRFRLLVTSNVWKTRGFYYLLGKELANSDLGQTVITKIEDKAIEAAFESTSTVMNWDIGGKTVKEHLASATDFATAVVNITQLLCSMPLFLVGIVKYALDNLSSLMDTELELVEELNTDIKELRDLMVTPIDPEFNYQFKYKIKMARDLLQDIVYPLAQASVQLEQRTGVTKSYMETVRSNIYAAKAVMTQSYDQAREDERITKNADVWEKIKLSGKESLQEAWGELSMSALNHAIEWQEKEKSVWNNYGALAKAHAEVRATLSGIIGTADMILIGGNFFDQKVGKLDKINEWNCGFYAKMVNQTANIVNRLISQMTAYLDNDSDVFDLTAQYPQWVGQLVYLTSSIYNEGFDLSSGWAAQTDELTGDYAKLANLKTIILALERDDPALLFFSQIHSFHTGFNKAAQGKGSISTIADYVNIIRDLYVTWIDDVKRMTTVEFEHYEALGDFVEYLAKWDVDVSNFKTGNISEVYSYGYLVGTGVDIVINCLIKKQIILEEDPKADEQQKSMVKSLLEKCQDIKNRKGDINNEAEEIKEQIVELEREYNIVKGILQNFLRMAQYTMAAARGGTEGAENWAMLAAMASYNEEVEE